VDILSENVQAIPYTNIAPISHLTPTHRSKVGRNRELKLQPENTLSIFFLIFNLVNSSGTAATSQTHYRSFA